VILQYSKQILFAKIACTASILVLFLDILFTLRLIAFLALLVERKQLESAGKNGFLPLSNVLGAGAYKCLINNDKTNLLLIQKIRF
jgi:hypothetical protein